VVLDYRVWLDESNFRAQIASHPGGFGQNQFRVIEQLRIRLVFCVLDLQVDVPRSRTSPPICLFRIFIPRIGADPSPDNVESQPK
jgi:hypothetical protein